ncbi:hypothetical protein QSI00_24645, partial [Escherichia coli]|uniref:hypothetical protein n=1 Tax=Escherichia coli TaxID=562 RepID=UPI00256F0085
GIEFALTNAQIVDPVTGLEEAWKLVQVGTCDTDRDTRSKKPLNFVRRFKGLVQLVANQGFEPRTCGL